MPNTQKSEKKSKHRFNAIDVFIILLVILCVVGVYFRGEIAKKIGIEKKVEEYQISFKVSEIRYTSSQYFYAGNNVYLNDGNILVGTIEGNCIVLPAEVYVDGPDGSPILSNYPKDTYVDITGIIKCEGLEKSKRFYLNGTYSLSPGSTLTVHTETVDFVMTITEISKLSK